MGVLLSLGSRMGRRRYADGTRMVCGWYADGTLKPLLNVHPLLTRTFGSHYRVHPLLSRTGGPIIAYGGGKAVKKDAKHNENIHAKHNENIR